MGNSPSTTSQITPLKTDGLNSPNEKVGHSNNGINGTPNQPNSTLKEQYNENQNHIQGNNLDQKMNYTNEIGSMGSFVDSFSNMLGQSYKSRSAQGNSKQTIVQTRLKGEATQNQSYKNNCRIVYSGAEGLVPLLPLHSSEQQVSTNDHIIPVMLSWAHGGKNVFVTGTFNQWKRKIRLNKRY